MSYSSRAYRHRNAHTHDQENDNEQSSFFKKKEKQSKSGGKGGQKPFFQAKLAVNEPGDAYEKEADSVAGAVVNHKGGAPVVQQKKITGVQRLATSEADEGASTDEERMKRDKEIQTKHDIQCQCSDCAKEDKEKPGVQKKGMEGKEEEKPGLQKKGKPEEEKKEETVQKKSKPEEEKEKKEAAPIQRKSEGGQTTTPQLTSRLKNSEGKGSSLPKKTQAEMQSAFGADFSNVRIHTDSDAADMNKELHAQAFTHGMDIYFNEGKFNPDSACGKQLLAHELTHVLQQQGGLPESDAAGVQRSPAGAVAVGAALVAAVGCAYAFYDYALNNYLHKGDKWMHCWVSCKIATWCGGPAWSLLVGAGKEGLDAAMDALGYHHNAEFADFVADMHGAVSCYFRSCEGCCDEYYPQ